MQDPIIFKIAMLPNMETYILLFFNEEAEPLGKCLVGKFTQLRTRLRRLWLIDLFLENLEVEPQPKANIPGLIWFIFYKSTYHSGS